MKHKKLKLIIMNCILCVILICILCVNSFAYTYDDLQISIVDLASLKSRQINIPINENVSQIVFYLDDNDCSLYVQLGIMDQTDTYFVTYVPYTFHCDVEVSAGQSYYTPYELSFSGNTSVSYGLDPSASNDVIYVTLEMYSGSDAVYTIAQYNAYGVSRFNDGVYVGEHNVTSDPNEYNLYSSDQYLQHGYSEYDRGYAAGIEDRDPSGDNDYASGYQKGLADGKTMVGLANVFLSNMYNVFLNFVNSTGIFGISLIAILTTAFIILIVWLIFKAVRS